MTIKQQLEKNRLAISNENVSYGEIAFLQNHQEDVKRLYPHDSKMWEFADISEKEWSEKC